MKYRSEGNAQAISEEIINDSPMYRQSLGGFFSKESGGEINKKLFLSNTEYLAALPVRWFTYIGHGAKS
ncbi:MAG: hypothetical protein WD688_00260 [Candidatus Binatia bacterium]